MACPFLFLLGNIITCIMLSEAIYVGSKPFGFAQADKLAGVSVSLMKIMLES